MSRDYELFGVEQDNPNLITYVREIHMGKFKMPFLKNIPIQHINFTDHQLIQEIGQYIVSDLLDNKKNGIFFQSFPGGNDIMMTAPWFVEKYDWKGYIVESDPRKYFLQRKQYVGKPSVQAIHACLSPNEYPKEVNIFYNISRNYYY